MIEELLKNINLICKLSETEESDFLKIIQTEVTLQKGDFWMHPNLKNHNIAFVVEGYLRKYYLKDGDELTDFFYFQNSFCADLPTILSGKASETYVVAMKPTHIVYFSYLDFRNLCKKYHAFESIYAVILEKTFLQFYERTTSFILQTPKLRYDQLLKTHPQILQEAKQYHIASYLGISYQHLSRLRSKK